MERGIVSGTLTAILLVGMLTLAFNIQPTSSKPEKASETFYAPGHRGIETSLDEWRANSEGYRNLSSPSKLNLYDPVNLRRFARCESEHVELLIGCDISRSQLQSVKEMIFKNGGKVTSTISVCEDTKVFTVLVPIMDAYIFANKLQENGLVEYLEPNLKMQAYFTPNDPYWPNQWAPTKVEADAAWNITVGSSNVTVAIIDTGIDYTHPDLTANYVSLGYDWVHNDTDPLDDNGHGTHCAGIVAATINNSIGIAGLAQVHVMAEKALNLDGWGYYSWIIQAIHHAVDAGAKIVSMSFGSFEDSPSIHDAIQYAYDHGVLLVAAAGNEGNSFPNYPAAYEEVIAVSATDAADNIAVFSSYGNWIELAAPGVYVYSTMPTYNVTLNEPPYNKTLNYDYASGTSMACPHVAGVAALIWSAFPNNTRDKIRQILKRKADDLGDVGFDQFYGYGRINAKRAVAGIPTHDLSISGWRHPYGIHLGEFGMFNTTISNYGKSNETNISVQFFVNETLVDIKTIDFLENEASDSVTFSWGTTAEGSYNVTCYVVPVPEENYTENNIASSIVFVRFSLTLKVPSEYSTIKDALNKSAEGDAIFVEEGFYAEGQIDIFKNNVTLVAVGNVTLNGVRTKPVLKIVADFVTIDGFNVQNGSCGIYVQGHNNNITGNFILNNGTLDGYFGICLFRAFNSTIGLNTIMSIDYSINVNTEYGIFLQASSNNTIFLNEISSAFKSYTNAYTHGIALYESLNNIISLNNVSNLHVGIWIYYSKNNTFISNTAINNWSGIVFDASSFNKLRNNIMTNNMGNFGVRLDNLGGPSRAINDVDVSNTVNGKPIYYWVGKFDAIIPLDAGCVVLVNCRGIKLQNLNLANNFHGALLINTSNTQVCSNNIMSNSAITEWYCGGIWMLSSSNNIVSMNNISRNSDGVWAFYGANNTIASNNFVDNGFRSIVIKATSACNVSFNEIRGSGLGICISYSKSNVVDSNNIEYGTVGLVISESDNVISSNNIIGCLTGMEVYIGTSYCIIKSNNIVTCRNCALYIMSSTYGNKFFHNNFIGNTYVYFEGGSNFWDDGYPSGGNYWSDYAGVDLYRGRYQNDTGSDGIGDTSYAIADTNNRDKYPLMKPYPWATHDIGITSVATSQTIVGQGYNVLINIMAFNYGNCTEDLNVVIYANSTTIGEVSGIDVASRNFTLVTFTWDTAGFPKGNYTIWVYVTIVPGEMDTEDNTKSSWVIVTMYGDFDGDSDIDIDDVRYFVNQYIAYWSGRPYDDRCDFDRNNDIDIWDIRYFVKQYIEYWKIGDPP